jgi:hypothetical protein
MDNNVASLPVVTGYPPVVVRLKKVPRVSLLESEHVLNAFDRRAAVQEVNRAINAWYYNQ